MKTNEINNSLRIYKKNTPQFYFYRDMHINQTLELSKSKNQKYSKMNHAKMSIKKALSLLDSFIDPSDPDLDIPNSIHAYQTAERIRRKFPDDKELQIVGLIHDLGKVLFTFGEPSWAVVGDTYVLGCKFPTSIVYYETLKESPEFNKYDKNGIYKEKCGIDNLVLSYGHDEYLFSVLKNNKNHKISSKYLDIIRYHSFYPWHSEGEYKQFMIKKDYQTLENVKQFNNFDLYSKEDSTEITPEIKDYYNKIIDEFFYGDLKW